MLFTSPYPTESHKTLTVGNVKIGPSPTTSSKQGLYRHGIAGQAASQVWLDMGGQGVSVRGVPGSIPRGTTTFDNVSFKRERLQREDSEKVLGLIQGNFFLEELSRLV